MARGRKKGAKIVGYNTFPFAFRLRDDEFDAPYLERLQGWLDEYPPNVARSVALVRVMKWLMDNANNEPLYRGSASVDVQALRDELMNELRDYVRSLIQDGARFDALSEARQKYSQSPDDIPDDIIDNVLADFGR